MKIQELVYNIIVEAEISNKLFQQLSTKWGVADKEEIQKIKDWFDSKSSGFNEKVKKKFFVNKDGETISGENAFTYDAENKKILKPGIKMIEREVDVPQILTFKRRFPEFNKPLKDILSYTLDEIKFLSKLYKSDLFKVENNVDEFKKMINEFKTNNWIINDDKINDSYEKLWKGNFGKIYDDSNGFKIFSIKNVAESKSFGYYEGFVAEKLNKSQKNYNERTGGFQKWCITRTGDDNMWTSYRVENPKTNRTFYFILDEDKNPFKGEELNRNTDKTISLDNLYYISAFQATEHKDINDFGRLSNLSNPYPEPTITLEKLLEIYTKLNNDLENGEKVYSLFKKVPFNISELGDKTEINVIQLMNEDPTSPYEFSKREPEEKTNYIAAGRYITKGISWKSMDDEQRLQYINKSQKENNEYLERFQTQELYLAILESNFLKELEHRLKDQLHIEHGVADIVANIIKTNYEVVCKSIELSKHHLIMFKEKGKKLNQGCHVGLFNSKTFKWVSVDGNNFSPDGGYKILKIIPRMDIESNTTYNVEIYSKTNDPNDETNFVAIWPILHRPIKRYFLTGKKWNEIEPKFKSNDETIKKYNPKLTTDPNIERNPENDDDLTDIRESKRRRY